MGKKVYRTNGEPLMAKESGCKNTPESIKTVVFTPVYECSVFRRCAPFAGKIEDDADPTHPCRGCSNYTFENKPQQ
jgi:hypothetical protein